MPGVSTRWDRSVAIADVLAGEPVDMTSAPVRPCIEGDAWQWDDVDFRVLHPRPGSPWTGNNASCVLEISTGEQRVLLTGDIEAPVERILDYRTMLRSATVALVPHHGSGTSSSDILVDQVRAEIAIVSAGYANRWGFSKDRGRRSVGANTARPCSRRHCPARST